MSESKLLTVYIPSYQKHVTVSSYIQAVKRAKENLTAQFPRTFSKWYGGTGADIMGEFMEMVHHKINENKKGQFIGARAK